MRISDWSSDVCSSDLVKLLEDTLGQPLFRRFNRRLVLTEAGQAYLPPLRDAFDAMDAATRALGRRGGPRQLRITTLQRSEERRGERVCKYVEILVVAV